MSGSMKHRKLNCKDVLEVAVRSMGRICFWHHARDIIARPKCSRFLMQDQQLFYDPESGVTPDWKQATGCWYMLMFGEAVGGGEISDFDGSYISLVDKIKERRRGAFLAILDKLERELPDYGDGLAFCAHRGDYFRETITHKANQWNVLVGYIDLRWAVIPANSPSPAQSPG